MSAASINPAEPPEVLYKKYLDVGDYEKACHAALHIVDRSASNSAKTEVWKQVLLRGRFAAVGKVEQVFNLRLRDDELDALLLRYKSGSLLDAVEVIKRFGALHWGPVIDAFLEELNLLGTACMAAIEQALLVGNSDIEEIEKKRLELIQKATEAVYHLKMYGVSVPNQRQDSEKGQPSNRNHRGRRDNRS
jgi:hypothetical protein